MMNNIDDKTKIQTIRKAIENIYDDNNKIEEEISLLNTVIISFMVAVPTLKSIN